jgi:hypothetical protein
VPIAGGLLAGCGDLLDQRQGGLAGESAGRVPWREHRYGTAHAFQVVLFQDAGCYRTGVRFAPAVVGIMGVTLVTATTVAATRSTTVAGAGSSPPVAVLTIAGLAVVIIAIVVLAVGGVRHRGNRSY